MTDSPRRNLVRWQSVYSFAVVEHRASGRTNDARDSFKRGGLAGAVRSYEGCNLAFANTERDAPQYLDVAVAGGHIFQLDQTLFLQSVSRNPVSEKRL